MGRSRRGANCRRDPRLAGAQIGGLVINDLDRLRGEYSDRDRRLIGSNIYSPFDPANLFIIQSRQRAVLRALRRVGMEPLAKKRILEVGCGSGGVLLEYLGFGGSPKNLHGCDLLPNRLAQAHEKLPNAVLACADGQNLPYPAQSYDLLLQYTALSSILDDTVRRNVAADMLRVLKPSGVILWYDFWLNPTNPQTRGIRPSEIRRLFPGCHYDFRRITLAPPIARRVVPISWLAAYFLEAIPFLRTHYLVVIRRP